MSGEQPSPLDDSDYGEIAEEIAKEMKEPNERFLSGEQPSLLDDSGYREIAEEIAEERKAEREAEAIPEGRKDEGKRLEVLKKVYSEGTSAVAFWISFILSGLTLALYLLTSYAPFLWVSTFFAAIWLFFLVIPRSSA